MIKNIIVTFILCVIIPVVTSANACSRFTYTAKDNTVITGRSMDWTEDLHTDIWAFPAGIARVGDTSANGVKWVSKYGSVIASAYNRGAADGINTQGLNANLLYLATADYGTPQPSHKNLSVFNWVQYVLDNYATVDEAVKGLSQSQFNMMAPQLPNGAQASLHLAITDSSGDNAVFEHINGKLVIHHGKQYTVMTNEPVYDKQLALTDYWSKLNGVFLPGTSEPEDRFVRAHYYLSTAPASTVEQKSVSIVFSIIRNLSAPISVAVTDRPNVASTLWRSVADLKNKVYFFESTDRPNIFWVDMNLLDLKAGAPVKKLPLANNEIYAAEVSKNFVDSKTMN